MPNQSRARIRTALLCATMLTSFAGLANGAQAQATAPAAQTTSQSAPKDDSTVVVVTGYRKSLADATKAKKDSTNFTESIFSEDMGKFPDLNLAEAMQRVPGMVVQRDPLTGDGTQISVRALPASFTQVTMNGNRIAVASDFGFSGSSTPNRQVDLDMFPTELFNRIDVSKTPSADTLEGGIAGTVNIQNARPFDRKGAHVVLSVEDGYNFNSKANSPRVSGLVSKTWDKFGILAGFSSTRKKVFSDGFETVGWTDPSLNNYCGSCDPSAQFPGNGAVINPAGSNGFSFDKTVYNYTGNGLTAGTTLSESQLLALNPGLTESQLKGAILPRLGRNYILDGTTSNNVGLVSMEYRPEDNLRFTLDILGGGAKRRADRSDMMWAVRSTGPGDTYNGGMIPLGVTVDSHDIVTGGTFANSAFLDENNYYVDQTAMASVNLGTNWQITDSLKFDAEVAYMHTTYERDVTFIKFLTPLGTNITVNYKNDAGNDIPTITPNINLNDPNLGWRLFQDIVQRDKRNTDSKSIHTNLTQVAGDWTFKAGAAYDEDTRSINIIDDSTAFTNAFNAAIPAASIGQYLTPMTIKGVMDGVSGAGFSNFILPNWSKIFAATNYSSIINGAGTAQISNTYNGAGASDIDEKIGGAYVQAALNASIAGVPVKSNLGFRFQNTDQKISSPSNLNGQLLEITTEHKYNDVLPSFNAVANVTSNLNLRIAASKTMTRANPSSMTSQLSYSDPGGQNASEGNPNLKPYYSGNLDIGGEYYTGGIGYVGLTLFKKDIKNYTYNSTIVEPFSALGVPFSSLTAQQQSAINVAGGPGTLMVNLSTPVNATQHLHINGQEFIWVQPLDFVIKGIGYSFNYTHFDFNNVNIQQGIPDYTYNLTAFYEHGNFSTHISYADVGRMTIGVIPSANSIPYNEYQQERHQIDLSASYKFRAYGFDQSITFDAVNIDKQGFKAYEGFKYVPYQYNNPGATAYIGWRSSF